MWSVVTKPFGRFFYDDDQNEPGMCWWVEDGDDQTIDGGIVGSTVKYDRTGLFDRGHGGQQPNGPQQPQQPLQTHGL